MKSGPLEHQGLQFRPAPEAFAEVAAAGRPQVVWTTLVADLETPVSAMLKLGAGRRNAFLLESVEGGAVRGRYSIIGLEPDLIWRANGERAEINRRPAEDPGDFQPLEEPTLDALRSLLESSRIELPEALPPMAAGVFGFMSYDTVRQVERLPGAGRDALGVPDAILIRPTVMVIFDAVKDEITIVTPVYPTPGGAPSSQSAGRRKTKAPGDQQTTYLEACERLARVVARLESPLDMRRDVTEVEPGEALPAARSNTPRKDYLAMVRKAKEYIAAGDIFQVVLSQRFSVPFTLAPFSLYRALRRTNPSPFLFFLDFGEFSIVGSSPEILVRVRDGEVTIRPIADTRPRGATPAEDRANAADLLADEKERAEHLMLVDLGRNDVGRVSEIGTVTLTDSFFLEYYSQVMHIVSNVTGRLRADRDAIDALMAGFPAGTVSGAPKVRAMQIIDELERDKRGPYAGCVGYFSANGQMDTCIVLRTALVKDGVMHVQAGAGIVADSIPESEQAECENKAKALFKAAEEAVRFASRGRGNQS
ncbi:MAG: anthranilate synthase component I [Rhizobiales bacterium]|nr:anthranilate synthase component I [Hyphomicrobiales bacterium]